MARTAADAHEITRKHAHISAQRYFEVSLLLMLATGFLTLATTGKLDLLSIAAVSTALAVKLWGYFRDRDWQISPRTVTRVSVFYIFFYVLDFLIFSAGPSPMDSMLAATVHLVLFTTVVKIFSARTNRVYGYLATLSFLMLLASAILTVGTTFLAGFSFYLLFAISTFISHEIKRSTETSRRAPEGPFTAAAKNRSALERALAGATAGLAIGIVLLAAVLFFVIPRYRTGYLTGLGMETQNITGFSGSVNLGDIRKILQSNLVVMRVVVEGDPRPFRNVKWRGVALTSFDGRNWYNDDTAQEFIPPASTQRYLLPTPDGWSRRPRQPLRYRILLSPISADVLFAAPVPRELRGRFRAVTTDITSSLHYPGHGFTPISYEVISDVGVPSPDLLRTASQEYPLEIRLVYLQTPDLNPRIAEIAAEVTAGAGNNYDRARALETWLSTNFGYSLDPPQVDPDDPVGSFLTRARSGYCEYFAASMAVMLRTLGIPSRIVNGFQTGSYNRVGKNFIVRARDAHSWVEVYFPEYGWIAFDPTPPDPNPVSVAEWGPFSDYVDAMTLFWNEWIINYDFGRQVRLAQQMESDTRRYQRDFRQAFRRAQRRAIDLAYQGEDWLMSHKLLVFLFMLSVLGAIVIAEKAGSIAELRFLIAWKFRRLDRNLDPEEAALTYREFLKAMDKKGFRKAPSQTPREFAFSLAKTNLSGIVSEFTALYNALRFGRSRVPISRLRSLIEQIAASRQ
jgi:transglutaminase-like putative cysteine protease